MRIKITSDSTCDLTPALIARHDITIFPLTIIKGDGEFLDGLEITPEDIFEYVESGAGITHTSAVNVSDFAEKFAIFSKDYDAVIHVSLGGDFSACCQNAMIAASDFDNVFVVDSRNLSSGVGHLVLDAAEMAEAGLPASEIVSTLKALVATVDASFVIDSLKYLYRGGRCSGIAALGANVLKLKPCIEVDDSKMTVGRKYRGDFDKVILQYITDRLKDRNDIDTRRIFITHASGVKPAVIERVMETIRSLQNFDEIIESIAGCTISHHCGPVCLGILYYRK
ncbi:DegV family protein [Oscillospiraceae bacterium WX1]